MSSRSQRRAPAKENRNNGARRGKLPRRALCKGKNKSMKEVFAERLKELRLERGLGQVQLAKELDVGKSVVSLWELGKCEPTLSKLIAMARFFGVSIDYLAGLED